MKIGSLFSGYGGLDLGVQQAIGGTVAWHCEFDENPSKILAHHWPDVPNYGDITATDFTAVEQVNVLTGGFPCQDVSHAGRRKGLIRTGDGQTRSGLWGHMLRAIDELRPALVVAENVRGLLSAEADSDMEPCPWCVGGTPGSQPPMRALGAVLADLADIGYDAAWVGLPASGVGAPHGRFRVFILAWPRDAAPDAADAGVAALTGALGAAGDRAWNQPLRDCAAPLTAVQLLPTPRTENNENRQSEGYGGKDGNFHGLITGASSWADYAPAITRWEHVLGRPAPAPTEPTGKGGAHRLSPRFVEWMMGLPAGHVTDVPDLSRNAQLKALGNGVVPQQAAAALNWLLAIHETEAAA